MDGKKMDIEIFPYRVLGSDTTEKLLNDIESLEDVKRTVIHGPRFPKTEETLPPQYRERRVININGEDVVLKVKTGRIFVELTMESTVKKIEEICKKQDIKPEDSIMIGSDVDEDLCSAKLGFDTYLITDTIVNRDNKDYSDYKNGSFEEFYKDFLKGD